MFTKVARRVTLTLTATLVLAPMAPLRAQTVVRQVGDDVKHVAEDIWRVWSAPVRGSGRDWLTAGLVVAGAAAISPLDDDVDRWAVRDSASAAFDALKPFRRGGIFFQGAKLVPGAAAVLVAGYATNNQDLRDAIWGCGASAVSNSVARNQVIYRIIKRTRPDSSKDNPPVSPPAQQGDQYDIGIGPKSWGEKSLPGGHIANITACASFLAERFHLGVAEPALYALVAAVGVGRIADRAHWTSDQLLGAAFGYAIGREIALRQNKRREASRREARDPNAAAAPAPRGAGDGVFVTQGPRGLVHLGWQKTF
jgi:membrane-associated phospholipid phosphatase